MQRYRVNFPLLIGLVVGTLVVGGGSFFLWRFQQERNAGRLIQRAEEARAEGDLVKASGFLSNYVRLRPDDDEALAKLAETMTEIAEQPDAEPKTIGQAIGILEATVREQNENDELRRRLVDFYMKRVGNFKSALDHIGQLLNRNPNDVELQTLRSTCLFRIASPEAVDHAFKLIGYDAASDSFDAGQAIAPSERVVYLRLANNLRSEKQDPRLADRVVDQLVEANDQDGEAWLARGQYLQRHDREEEGKADLAKALELSPDKADIVVANARLLINDEKYDEAQAMLLACLEEQPEEASLYQTLADTELRSGEYDAALEWFQKGIDALPVQKEQALKFSLARLHIEREEFDSAKQVIDQMREDERTVTAFVDYLDARLKMSKNNWFEAVQDFERLRGFMSNVPGMGIELEIMLALSYEKLGQLEKALEAYNGALALAPDNKIAGYGRDRVLGQLGVGDQRANSRSIYIAMAEELAKPVEEQDWATFDKQVDAYIDRLGLSEAMRMVLKAEVLMRRGKLDQSRKMLVGAFKLEPDNLGVRRAAVKLIATDPKQGPKKALTLLSKVVEDLGDLPILRLERGDLLIAIGDDNLTDQLFALGDGIDEWTQDQKIQFWDGLANKFSLLRDMDSRQECLRRVAELSPGDLGTLQRLFIMAREGNDDAGMKKVQERILNVVGSKEDPTYLFTEAHRLISEYRTNGAQGEGLKEAEAMVERALAERGEWHRLYQLQAEINLLKNDEASALASFDKAAQYGRPTTISLFQHVKLLIRRGRYPDALREMERASPDIRQRMLGREYAESLLRTGQLAEAVTAADQLQSSAANNAKLQLWLGQFYSQASGVRGISDEYKSQLLSKTGEALQESVEIDPSSSEAWLALVTHLMLTKQVIKAEDAVRRAQLVLQEDRNVLLFARCFEILGRAIDAEALYKQAVETADQSDIVRSSRLLAQFYLGPVYRKDTNEKVIRATPHINTVLKEVAEGRADSNDPNVRWVRSTGARLLSVGGEYQQLTDAERLLASNAVDGVLPASDRLLMANILAPRPEPVSRLKAAKLYEGLNQSGALTQQSELALAKLYYSLGEWDKCREQIVTTIAKNPQDPSARLTYVSMLLERGGPSDIDAATRQLQRLVKLSPKSTRVRELIAQVAFKRGKKREASAAVASMLPRDASKITEEGLPAVRRVALLLTEFEDYERAGNYYQVAAKIGGVKDRLALAQFVGKHVDADEGFSQLDQARGAAELTSIVQAGMNVLRAEETTDPGKATEHAKLVQSWLDRGLREDPDNNFYKMQQADLHDFNQDYASAAKIYRELVEGQELTGLARAVVLNNLAYLLALAPQDQNSVSEAVKCINEAVDLLGPQTDVLDTRAVVSLAAERYPEAVEDLTLAVIDKPSATKFFHKAVAHVMNGQMEEAIAAWERATELGLTREEVNQLERERFDQVKQQLEGAGLRSAQL